MGTLIERPEQNQDVDLDGRAKEYLLSYLKLAGGTVYDPANGIDGVAGDIYIKDGKIVASPEETETKAFLDSTGDGEFVEVVDVRGMVVMPGGVDMHCHIAGPKVNAARKMQPEQYRGHGHGTHRVDRSVFHSGATGSVPTIFTTGYKYTGLGYTTCFDAAISPLASRHVHHEFNHIPNVDTGFFTLVGNNHFVMRAISESDDAKLDAFLGWLIDKVGAFAPKIVNPGGVELWKQNRAGNARDLDQTVDGFGVTPRSIIAALARSANRLNLPHPVHIHTNNLGMPGNWKTTLETMRTLDDQRGHLTHIQFHSYGGGGVEEATLCSRVAPLADFVNGHSNITVDVGQVMFGPTISLTGDGPLGYYLQQINGTKWYSSDTELESGCGISPLDYKDKNFVHSLQWAIGLEWYLMVDDPWQVVMSTDHPNGGSFMAYPQIIRLLMDADYRREKLKSVSPRVLEHCELASLDREYSLYEIAIITRSGPARILGLKNKGHLGIGGDADITIYTPDQNRETMFAVPRYVIKSGQFVVRDHELRHIVTGKTIAASAAVDIDRVPAIEAWLEQHYSLTPKHYGIAAHEFPRVVRQ